MFRRTLFAMAAALSAVGLSSMAARVRPGADLAPFRARSFDMDTPGLGNYQGSGGHRSGRGSGRKRGAPKGGISGAGLWREGASVAGKPFSLSDLRELCGSVEDGSHCTVKIFQDDATKSWVVHVERLNYYGGTMLEALTNARDGISLAVKGLTK